MARRGWHVTVVTANTDGVDPFEAVDGIRVLRLPAWGLLGDRVPVPIPSSMLRALLRGLVADPPDVYVSNTRFFPTSVLAAALAWLTRRPLLHVDHGSAFITLGRKNVDRITRFYDKVLGGWVLGQADVRCGVSQAVCDFLRAFGVHDAKVLYNGVDTDGWDCVCADYRQLLQLGPNDVLVAYVGRLIEEKGVSDMLEAFRHCERNPHLHLAVAGAGPLTPVLENAAQHSKRIHMLGRLTPSEVHDLLIACDILAHPSKYPEGLPTVLLEGAAAGAAIVATPMGGTAELITDGANGLIVKSEEPKALGLALWTLAADDELRRRLGESARQTVAARFDWEIISDRLEELLADLLPPRRAAETHSEVPLNEESALMEQADA
jgi:glycosyltransferase involved in cell wall biosynthesis